MQRIRKSDQVEVIAGEDRGVKGTVMSIDHSKGKVLVEGVNEVYKHLRRSRQNPQGGRITREAPVDISNVMLVCPKCDRGVRVSYRTGDDGKKVRVCRRCDNTIGDNS